MTPQPTSLNCLFHATRNLRPFTPASPTGWWTRYQAGRSGPAAVPTPRSGNGEAPARHSTTVALMDGAALASLCSAGLSCAPPAASVPPPRTQQGCVCALVAPKDAQRPPHARFGPSATLPAHLAATGRRPSGEPGGCPAAQERHADLPFPTPPPLLCQEHLRAQL